jgi:hypothetical protein
MIGAVLDRRIRVFDDDRAAFLQGPLDELHLAALGPAVVPEPVLADHDVRGDVVGAVEGALAGALQANQQADLYGSPRTGNELAGASLALSMAVGPIPSRPPWRASWARC